MPLRHGTSHEAGPTVVVGHIGQFTLVFRNGKIVIVPPCDPAGGGWSPALGEVQRATDVLAKAETIRQPATLVKLGRTDRALIMTRLTEIQEILQQQVAVQ